MFVRGSLGKVWNVLKIDSLLVYYDSYHFFFFNDTATTEIYTPFPTRRSSDLMYMRKAVIETYGD